MAGLSNSPGSTYTNFADDNAYLSHCGSCGQKSLWIRRKDYRPFLESMRPHTAGSSNRTPIPNLDELPTIVTLAYPRKSDAPEPNADLPPEILPDYKEAAAVLAASPRAAAALLRLCLQKLCKYFGRPGKDINKDIKELVADRTISPRVQKLMDTVRIVGNEAVHPGVLNLNDDRDLAIALFSFVNLIAEEAISIPKQADEIYARLPEAKRQAVAQRDNAVD